MTILELRGRMLLVSVKVAVEVSPTNAEEADTLQVIVFGNIIKMPVLAKGIPNADAVIGKLLA